MAAASPSFHLTIQAAGDAWIVRPEGILDESSTAQLLELVMERVRTGSRKFVLDGSGVGMADSSALGKLVRCYSDVRSSGGFLVLSQVSPEFRRSLNVTRLVRFFSLYPSNDEAIAALG